MNKMQKIKAQLLSIVTSLAEDTPEAVAKRSIAFVDPEVTLYENGGKLYSDEECTKQASAGEYAQDNGTIIVVAEDGSYIEKEPVAEAPESTEEDSLEGAQEVEPAQEAEAEVEAVAEAIAEQIVDEPEAITEEDIKAMITEAITPILNEVEELKKSCKRYEGQIEEFGRQDTAPTKKRRIIERLA